MKKLLFLVFLLMLPLALAVTQSLPTQKQNSCVQLPQTCGNCSYVNITSVQYPDSTIEIIGIAMTQQGSQYNYTFCNTTQLGTYIVNTEADGVAAPYDFAITTTGTLLTTGTGIMYVMFTIIGFFVFVLVLYGAIKVPFRNERGSNDEIINVNYKKYLKIFLITMSYIILMFLFALSRGIASNFINDVGVTEFFDWMYWLMISMMYPLIVVIAIFTIITYLGDKKLANYLERGVPFR